MPSSSVTTAAANSLDAVAKSPTTTPQSNRSQRKAIDEVPTSERYAALAMSTSSDYDESDEEKDLTSLTWLTELRNQNIAWPNAINAPLDDDKDANATNANDFGENPGDDVPDGVGELIALSQADSPSTMAKYKFKQHKKGGSSGKTNILAKKDNSSSSRLQQAQQLAAKRPTPTERYEMFLDKVRSDLKEYEKSAKLYQNDTFGKPPFNYSNIIGMAMLENGRVTLQQICSWIESKFAFFRVRKKWNNSIRHNLSLHYCFRKINRNKYEKGKGGYWELGVDPKKCDRKRIRNRKSAQTKHKQLHNSKTIPTPAATTITDAAAVAVAAAAAPANENDPKSNYSFQLSIESASVDNEMTAGESLAEIVNFEDNLHEIDGGAQSLPDGMELAEELLLDELDVQQNIDISSCGHQQQQQLLHHQPSAELGDECALGDSELPHFATVAYTHDGLSLGQPQYQLGTIIISTSAADVAAASNTLNCLINENYCNQRPQRILYAEDEIPSACENVIVSSYIANGIIDELSIIANNHDQDDRDRQHFAQQRPNVIVEQLEPSTAQHYSVMATATSAPTLPLSAIASSMGATSASNCDYSHNIGDNFRPYIDGIEEAFQYLRSMDNNREDILDNLLDISVCDY